MTVMEQEGPFPPRRLSGREGSEAGLTPSDAKGSDQDIDLCFLAMIKRQPAQRAVSGGEARSTVTMSSPAIVGRICSSIAGGSRSGIIRIPRP